MIKLSSIDQDCTDESRQIECLTTVPIEKCNMVVHMPTVEEMRQEVANITCQMQSVYVNPNENTLLIQVDDGVTCKPSNDTESKIEPSEIPRLVNINFINENNTFSNKENLIDTQEIVNSPKEEQVFEEFEINGKRFRQTYQKRVVLEKRTTRDVFFLPGNQNGSSLRGNLEYCTPNFKSHVQNLNSANVLDQTIDPTTSDRLGLDLQVTRNSHGEMHDDWHLLPSVILKSATMPSHCTNNGLLVGQSDNILDGAKDKKNKNKVSTVGTKHNFAKRISHSIRNRLGFKVNKKINLVTMENGISQSTLNDTNNKHTESQEILNYMYKFGIWDSKQPILDPRLTLALNCDTSNRSVGSVIPTLPEWHHSEVNMDGQSSSQNSSVYGRTVACLQRFTQQSLVSGKPLYRSTYVQKTKLVRQRNPNSVPNDLNPNANEHFQLNFENNSHQSNAKTEESLDNNDFDNSLKNGEFDFTNLNNNFVLTTKTDNGQLSANFIKCSGDRLQLLQSVCPSAAAATILLGKSFNKTTKENGNDGDLNLDENDNVDERNLFREKSSSNCVKVTSDCWCPMTLKRKDLSTTLIPCLHPVNEVFREGNQGHKSALHIVSLPEPSIRGGTLDSLILYILNILKTNQTTPDNNSDYLLPNVIRLIYPIFTKPEIIIERLIYIYIANAPIEPGSQDGNWIDALVAVKYLVMIVKDLSPSQLNASLILRLNRFTRLLQLDGQSVIDPSQSTTNTTTDDDTTIGHQSDPNIHKHLAEELNNILPPLSSNWSRTQSFRKLIPIRSGAVANQLNTSANGTTICQEDQTDGENEVLLVEQLKRINNFLNHDSRIMAEQLTQMEENNFAQIDFQELLDIHNLERGEAKTLGVCVKHFNQLTNWTTSLLFVLIPKLSLSNLQLDCLTSNNTKSDPIKYSFSSLHKGSQAGPTSVTKTTPIINYSHSDKQLSPKRSLNCMRQNKIMNEYPNCENKTSNSTQWSDHVLCTATAHSKNRAIQQLTILNIAFLKFCDILKHLKKLNNFSTYLALLLAIQEIPECLLSKKSRSLLKQHSAYMQPPNFIEYRRDLEAASLPCLPYLGLIFQQLIHLHTGNTIYLSVNCPNQSQTELNKLGSNLTNASPTLLDNELKSLRFMSHQSLNNQENYINVWRCWKHYLILGYFVKRKEDLPNSKHNFEINLETASILNEFRDCFSESIINKAKDDLFQLADFRKYVPN